MKEFILAIIAIIIVLGIYWIRKYNAFHRLVNNVEESSSGIDIALTKRFDLITNLVETVKGYTKHEEKILKEVTEIRTHLNSDRELAEEMMQDVSFQLLAVAEAYPDLKASEQFLSLQKSLNDVEEHLQAARRLYNRNVTELNVCVDQFPTNIIAKNMGVEKRVLFQADESKRENIDVNF